LIPGKLQIDIISSDNKKLSSLYNGKIGEGIFLITWDGKDPANKVIYSGAYKIRWTLGKGYREFPVIIN
jgi:flagellar hook assembly protein FlgD